MLIIGTVGRLGREQMTTTYRPGQSAVDSVRVFDAMEDREPSLDSPTDQRLPSATTDAAEMERHQARQRPRDARLTTALRGYVTGGTVFGSRDVEVVGEGARRQHVVGEPDEPRAEIVGRIARAEGAMTEVRQ